MAAEGSPYTLGDYLDVFRRRWIYLATLLPSAILVAVYIAFTLPPMYLSSGTILLEQATVPYDLVRTTVTTYADQQIELVQRRVMSIENLTALVEQYDPYPDDHELGYRAKARLVLENTRIEKVDPITLEPLLVSSAFSIHYYNPDPVIVAEMAHKLVELFLASNRITRTERASKIFQFLQTQSRDVERRLIILEQRLADFKAEYGDSLPEAQDRNLAELGRADKDLDALHRQILTAEERKALLDLQIAEVGPYLFGDVVGGWQGELLILRADLAAALQRYTEEHPQVRRLRRSIAAVSARATVMTEIQRPPDNPEYLRLTSQLRAVGEELDALHARADRDRTMIAIYEQRLVMTPDVERNYRQINREHDIVQGQFRDVQNKLSEAAMAQTLEETEDQGERFSLIRAPTQPSTPASPNRVGIILLGFVLGSAISAGLVALKESVDPSIRGARDLAEITDIMPIGAVPIMLNSADRRRRQVAWGAAATVFALALFVVVSAVSQGTLH